MRREWADRDQSAWAARAVYAKYAQSMSIALRHRLDRQNGRRLSTETEVKPLRNGRTRKPVDDIAHVVTICFAQPALTWRRRGSNRMGFARAAMAGALVRIHVDAPLLESDVCRSVS